MLAMEKGDDAPILKCEDISLRFGGVNALLDITFEVNKGEILSIIGPNGAEETPGGRRSKLSKFPLGRSTMPIRREGKRR